MAGAAVVPAAASSRGMPPLALRSNGLDAPEAAPITEDFDRERFLLRQIRRADKLRVLHTVSPLEQSLDDPFGFQRTESARMNITIALPAVLDRLL
jgi:hypothetical protein